MQKNPFVTQQQTAAPVQQVQVNPYATQAKPVASSDTDSQSLERPADQQQNQQVSEAGYPKLGNHQAHPKVVMNDKFFGKSQTMQIQEEHANGNYQAKISLPKDNDFLPPESLMSESKDAVDTSTEESTLSELAPNTQLEQPSSKAAPELSPKVASKTSVSASDLGAKALEMASTNKATSPKYALHGKCPVTLLSESKWVDGDPRWGCVHRERIYIFSTEQNLKAFQNDPDAHSPILAGYDPVVYQESGQLVNGLEKHGVFMGKAPHQRIVLFANAKTRAQFQSQPKNVFDSRSSGDAKHRDFVQDHAIAIG